MNFKYKILFIIFLVINNQRVITNINEESYKNCLQELIPTSLNNKNININDNILKEKICKILIENEFNNDIKSLKLENSSKFFKISCSLNQNNLNITETDSEILNKAEKCNNFKRNYFKINYNNVFCVFSDYFDISNNKDLMTEDDYEVTELLFEMNNTLECFHNLKLLVTNNIKDKNILLNKQKTTVVYGNISFNKNYFYNKIDYNSFKELKNKEIKSLARIFYYYRYQEVVDLFDVVYRIVHDNSSFDRMIYEMIKNI